MSSHDKSQSKKNQGRRKVNMAKIEKESNRQVTFSKRRAGLFKKASELCTLSGAEAAVLVFSPGNKAHTFGNPDFNTVTDRFLNPNSSQVGNVSQDSQMDLEYLAHLESLIEAEKAKGEELERARKACQRGKWVPPEELSYQQLECLRGAIMEFCKNVEVHMGKAVNPMMQNSCNPFAADSEANSSDDGTVVPYDQGATGAGEAENMPQRFNNGNDGRGSF